MPVADLQPGDPERIGPYRVFSRLGAGARAVVYLVQVGGGLGALKLFHPHLADDPEFRARFRQDIDARLAFNGPKLAGYIDAEVDARRPYLVTEYVDGPSLADAIADGGPFELSALVDFAGGLAEALRAIANMGVVHPDLMPSGVILGPTGPRIIDFGISCGLEAATSTGTGLSVGASPWTAPEAASGEAVTPAADVFAWGAVVAFAATGRPPFGEARPGTIPDRMANEQPDLAGVDVRLAPFIAAALSRDPAGRPGLAALLSSIRTLDGAHRPDPIAADSAPGTRAPLLAADHPPEVTAQPPAPRPFRLHRVGAIAAFTVLALVAAGAGLSLLIFGHRALATQHPSGSSPSTTAVTTTTTTTTTTTAPLPPGNMAYPALIDAPNRNLPDPFVLKVPGGYELYASQTGLYAPNIPTAFSQTLNHWPAVQAAMPVVPQWATQGFVWAPDVRYLDGRYVMFFDSMAQPTVYFDPAASGFPQYAQCIGVAISSTPSGPFVGQSQPLICDLGAHGAIDPRTFLAPNGQLYLDWKSDNNAAYPAPFAPTNLYAEPLAPNGLSLSGPAHLLMSADAPWQAEIIEAPGMVRVRGKYWLVYSGSWFNDPRYGVGVASCAGPIGPCKDLSPNGPWIGTNEQGAGPGEESLFEDRSGQWWLAYSPWYYGFQGRTYRPVAMAPLGFGTRGPYVAKPPAPRGTSTASGAG